MTTGHVAEFDPTEELPNGTMVLEASAGTGKTYAIVSLAVRYLAEGKVAASVRLWRRWTIRRASWPATTATKCWRCCAPDRRPRWPCDGSGCGRR